MFRLRIVVAILVIILSPKNEAAKILGVFPTPSISHQVVFRQLTNELVRLGHEVNVITTDPAFPKGKAPANLTEIDLHDISYGLWAEKITNVYNYGDKEKNLAQLLMFVDVMIEITERQFQEDKVMDIIKHQRDNFDLIIAEGWTDTVLGFSHVIKAPVIQFMSFGPVFDQMDVLGAVSHPVLYPMAPLTRVHNMTLWEKFQQYYYNFIVMRNYFKTLRSIDDSIKRVFGLDTPPVSELKNNVDMFFANMHPIWDNNRPVPPGVIYIPGLHQNVQKELPKDLKQYLDSSVHGVIYISFGTNVNTLMLSSEKVQVLVKAFSELPYDILWKWNEDVLPGRTNNIRISKWLPQSDLLRHPNVKLFITQGGLQSTDEAITAGVPLIGIPMLGDQWYNVDNYVNHKIGLKVDLQDLEVESLKTKIKKIIENKTYRENIVRLRTLMEDRPESSLQRAVWWTEHVLRHGGARHLRAPAANMPWTEYYEIDLILIVLSALLVVIALICITMFSIYIFIMKLVSYKVKSKTC